VSLGWYGVENRSDRIIDPGARSDLIDCGAILGLNRRSQALRHNRCHGIGAGKRSRIEFCYAPNLSRRDVSQNGVISKFHSARAIDDCAAAPDNIAGDLGLGCLRGRLMGAKYQLGATLAVFPGAARVPFAARTRLQIGHWLAGVHC
jgi:hypothetical protein